MSSIVSVSPSFGSNSFNNLVDIADRVVQELRTENGFDDDDFFDFSSDDNRPDIGGDDDDVNSNTRTEKVEENDPYEDEQEFEFPVVCGESDSSPISMDHEVISESQILPRYPLFDRSLLLDVDPDFSNAVGCSEIESTPSPVARLSLKKLFSEERDSASSSSSEADDLDRITPGSYCVWKPNTESRGNHKKSYSIGNNISKRWKVRDLLKRSYSDDNYSTGKDTPVVLFTPPITTKQNTNNEKVKKIEKTAKVVSAVGMISSSTKTENNIPVHKSKAGGTRRPPYYPYRQDQVGVFAHFNGSSRNLYRY
ncbi:uncharacterized protein LOC112511319 [Cynara cardunculus var. scolymus]|uniref:uncharacterized protein LOC112511319 n=1 Tax=Cynara cardunculus var. scolymus TaxID=59895 RepID=UPI000D628363|nr:uncharacterized protein LOC112511319 [Cynara cardunculus var. scolymus]